MSIHHPTAPRKNTSFRDVLSAAEKRAEDPATVASKLDDETALLYAERILDNRMNTASHCWVQACAQYPVLQKMHSLVLSYNDKLMTLRADHATEASTLAKIIEKLATENKKNKKTIGALRKKIKGAKKKPSKKKPASKKKPVKKK